MRTRQFTHWISRSIRMASVATLGLGLAGYATAQTPVGTEIRAQALIEYGDEAGNNFVVQSNIAIMEVAQVYAANVGYDVEKLAVSNSIVSFPFNLNNTGNGTDTYSVSVANDAGDTGDFTSVAIYHDENTNGIVDIGETVVSSVSVEGGAFSSIVVVAQLPAAISDDIFDLTLTISTSNGTVTDSTSGRGVDGLDGTVRGRAVVMNAAVIQVSNDMIDDPIAKTITQTITVTNIGGNTAHDVVIWSGRTWGRVTVNSWRSPDITSYVSSGFGTNIDSNDIDPILAAGGFTLGFDETTTNIDLNGDGDFDDINLTDLGVDVGLLRYPTISAVGNGDHGGVYAVDNTLLPGASVQLVLVRDYNAIKTGTYSTATGSYTGGWPAPAGFLIPTQAHVSWDTDDDGDMLNDSFTSSTISAKVVSQYYGAAIDGLNGSQANYADASGAKYGQPASLSFSVTNTGNGTDAINLSVRDFHTDSASFYDVDDGMTYSFWHADGTQPLYDSSGDGIVDTGPMGSGRSMDIVVKAATPASSPFKDDVHFVLMGNSASGENNISFDEYFAGLGTTYNAANVGAQWANGKVTSFATGGMDLSLAAADNDPQIDNDAYTANTANLLQDEVALGAVYLTDFFIQNDSGNATSYSLLAYGDEANGALPQDWSVRFLDANGQAVITTPLMPADSVFQGQIEVSVPNDGRYAQYNSGVFDYNSDGDTDYPVVIKVEDIASDITDQMIIVFDTALANSYVITEPQNASVRAGNSVDIRRNINYTIMGGNITAEIDTIGLTHSQADWSGAVMVDTNGDGVFDAPFNSILAGDTVWITDVGGVGFAQTLVTGVAPNGILELEPGQSLDVIVRIFAPTNAPAGVVNQAVMAFNGNDHSVTDIVTIIDSALTLEKTLAVDANCSGVATSDLGPDAGFAVVNKTGFPGDCAVWQIVGTNAGSVAIDGLMFDDIVPAFSVYQAGSLRACVGDAGLDITPACTFATLTDTTGDDAGEESGGILLFDFSQGASPILASGILPAGQAVTVRYATQVE